MGVRTFADRITQRAFRRLDELPVGQPRDQVRGGPGRRNTWLNKPRAALGLPAWLYLPLCHTPTTSAFVRLAFSLELTVKISPA